MTERAVATMSSAQMNRFMRDRMLGIETKMDSPVVPNPTASEPSGPPTRDVTLTRQDGDYWMSLDVADMMDMGSPILTRLKVWFHQTPTPDDRIFLRATSMFSWCNAPSSYYNTLLNQIDVSCAKMIGIVDREVSGLDVYFMLACDELLVRGYGYFILKPNGRTLPKNRDPEEQVLFAYSDRLFQRAVDNGWITEEERDTVYSGQPVYITRDQFEARVGKAKGLTVEGYTPPAPEADKGEEGESGDDKTQVESGTPPAEDDVAGRSVPPATDDK